MLKYIVKKILIYILVLFLVQSSVFFMFQVLPGNPIVVKLGIEGADNEKLKESLEKEYSLDKSTFERYKLWIYNSLQGNFGESISYEGYEVNELIKPRLYLTLKLSVFSLIFSTIIGLLTSIYMALNPINKMTRFIKNLVVLNLSMPSFWVGILLISIFGTLLNLVSVTNGDLFLPIISLTIPSSAILIKHLTTAMIAEASKDYVNFEKIKGLSDRKIMTHHILKNSLISIISILGTIFMSILTGSVLIENVFSLNGIGRFMVSGIKSYDYSLIQGIIIYYAIIILTISWLIDISYYLIDKRINIA